MSRPISKKTLLVGLAAAGALGVGIAVPTMAFADGSAAPTPSASASSTTSTRAPEQRRAERESEFAAALAKELGIPQDKVAAALTKVQQQFRAEKKFKREEKRESKAERQAELKARLDTAVKDGKLTQEQADAILKAFEAGVLPGFGGPDHHRWRTAPQGTTPEGSTPQGTVPTK